MFENDVKMYGIQTALYDDTETVTFENDVKMYGIQTILFPLCLHNTFENDVKMYGIQTDQVSINSHVCLRMM